jgi:hypothetical protein
MGRVCLTQSENQETLNLAPSPLSCPLPSLCDYTKDIHQTKTS